MNNIMLDLETMGNKPNVAIGAVFFEPATVKLCDRFYTAVNLGTEMVLGAVPSADTIQWWLKQCSDARSAITADDAASISDSLYCLSDFVRADCHDTRLLEVWGNGPSFDNVILHSAYERTGLNPFWKFWNDRSVRAMVMLGRQIYFDPKRDLHFDGDRHNALHDAIHQAQYVSAIYRRLMSVHQQDKELL